MARITVEDCLDKVVNQYDLVLLAKERTSQLNSGAEPLVEEDNDKRTVIALREIATGKLDVEDLKKNAILRLRKEPDETIEEEETEEVSSDDFEKQYKGEVSKSGHLLVGDLAKSVWQYNPCDGESATWLAAGQRRHMHRRRGNVLTGVASIDVSGPHEPTPMVGCQVAQRPGAQHQA